MVASDCRAEIRINQWGKYWSSPANTAGYDSLICAGRSEPEVHAVGRALDPAPSAVKDMGVDHRGADVAVAEELLAAAMGIPC